MPRHTTLLLAAAVMLVLTGCENGDAPLDAAESAPPQAKGLQWRAIWLWGLTRKSEQDAQDEVALSQRLGFNVIILSSAKDDYIRQLLKHAHAAGLQVYLGVNPVYGEWGFQKAPGVVPPANCLQEYPKEEVEQLDHPTDPDLPPYVGPWMCVDRPEVRQYAAQLATSLAETFHPDGLAIDFVGYKNYRGCKCAFSEQKRAEFVQAHKSLPRDEAEKEFSLAMITALYQEIRDALSKITPPPKLACHAYPPFEPKRFYGARLPVDFPAETVAWYFKPHWPLDKVAQNCRTVRKAEAKFHPYVCGTGMIGLDMAEKCRKTPERVADELRAVKKSGLRGLMVAGPADFARDPAIAQVLEQELNEKPERDGR